MRFDELREELARMEAALTSSQTGVDASALAERRTTAKLQLDSVVYPVLTLPGEVTSEIFTKCVDAEAPFEFQRDSSAEFPYRVTPFASEAPLLLLQICRTWTSIALGTPALWVNLSTGQCLGPNGTGMVPPEARVYGIDRWLRRASALPVSLSLFGATDSATSVWLQGVRALLSEHASRLGSLSLAYNLDASALGEPVRFPILHSLTINHASPSNALIRTFSNAPQLREVCFEFGSPLRPPQIELPWHQLTAFTADKLPIPDCLGILRECPRLKSLTLGWLHDTGPRRSLVVHKRLETLSISHLSAGITHLLDLPALRALTLHEVTFDGVGLLAFLRRSSRSLRALTYRADRQSAVSTITLEWFRIAKGLREVKLSGLRADFLDVLFSALDRAADPTFLAELHYLELSASRFTVDAPVVAALRSRFPVPVPETNALKTDVEPEPNAVRLEPKSSGTTLESLGLIVPSPYNYDISWDELGPIDWDALHNLGMDGMDIYAGSDTENLLWEW
ncbi:hypothetical protein C8R46DRAFT_1098807 [Mycena filopes]|nr:hypothetical protein C8R46DRAFT_1098807 [Mycena filopes]